MLHPVARRVITDYLVLCVVTLPHNREILNVEITFLEQIDCILCIGMQRVDCDDPSFLGYRLVLFLTSNCIKNSVPIISGI
jgi:hypothetical protein